MSSAPEDAAARPQPGQPETGSDAQQWQQNPDEAQANPQVAQLAPPPPVFATQVPGAGPAGPGQASAPAATGAGVLAGLLHGATTFRNVHGANTEVEGTESPGTSQPALPTTGSGPVDAAVAKMKSANAVFNAPDVVDVDDNCPCRIDFVLDATRQFPELQNMIREMNPSASGFHNARVQISDYMQATLTADPDDFIIDPATPQKQLVSDKRPAQWNWMVTPKTWGEHALRLELDALVSVDGESRPMVIRTFDQRIDVTVTPMSLVWRFVKAYWQWIAVTLLIPLVKWWWSHRRKAPRSLPVPSSSSRHAVGLHRRVK